MTQAPRNEILLHLGQHGWKATFTGPKAKAIIDQFDAATILTAYTANAPLATVIASLQARNPDFHVRHWIG